MLDFEWKRERPGSFSILLSLFLTFNDLIHFSPHIIPASDPATSSFDGLQRKLPNSLQTPRLL
jgi:hypothetical protein